MLLVIFTSYNLIATEITTCLKPFALIQLIIVYKICILFFELLIVYFNPLISLE